jgi:energy-coupling factor transport system substrate-specific component
MSASGGATYAQMIKTVTPTWMLLVVIITAIIGGAIGGFIGNKILNKHFVKSGITS